jgi:hypothetical protein
LIGENKVDGFRPWDRGYPDREIPSLSPTEFDSCWLPLRQTLSGGNYGPVFYLPFSLMQRVPLREGADAGGSSLVIDLPWESPAPGVRR